ncbi:hypothetical protein GALL_401840 [mine drainage metagenome]|uniref:Uncharacterized protein n=1 Tax=mine drainage metagenome TaxID=410659 RepID=A0A1J5Q471_9ZZZZ
MRTVITKPWLKVLIALMIASVWAVGSANAAVSTVPKCPSFGPNTPSGPHPGRLAPTSPQAAVLCHYAASNEKAKFGTLVRSVKVVNPKTLAKLLNQAKLIKGTFSCPVNKGGQDLIIFVAKGVETYVSLSTTGCRDAISSNTSDGYFLSKAAIVELAKLDPAFK